MSDLFTRAAKRLEISADTMRDRDAMYGGTDDLHAAAMAAIFRGKIEIRTADDFRRFSLINMMVLKLTRYTANYQEGGHEDSITDLINYSAALAEVDAEMRRKDAGAVRIEM